MIDSGLVNTPVNSRELVSFKCSGWDIWYDIGGVEGVHLSEIDARERMFGVGEIIDGRTGCGARIVGAIRKRGALLSPGSSSSEERIEK
jgi:hypothetical protein